MSIISIGYNNFVPKEKIAMILQINSRPIKNIISNAGKTQRLIDASNGKKRKAVILTTDGFVILSAVTPVTLASRFNKEKDEEES